MRCGYELGTVCSYGRSSFAPREDGGPGGSPEIVAINENQIAAGRMLYMLNEENLPEAAETIKRLLESQS